MKDAGCCPFYYGEAVKEEGDEGDHREAYKKEERRRRRRGRRRRRR